MAWRVIFAAIRLFYQGEIARMMAERGDIMTLSAVHEQLVDALARLENAGHHTAAAHLVAAIEALESDIGISFDDDVAGIGRHSVAILARRMTEDFGERAEEVARGQLSDATGQARLAWTAIVKRLL